MNAALKGIGGTIGIIGALVAGFGMYNNSAASTVGAIIACGGILIFAVGSMIPASR